MPKFDQPPPTTISASSQSAFTTLKSCNTAILCGRNNSGKSFVLRKLIQEIGDSASYLGAARYNNFTHLSAFNPPPNWKAEKWRRLIQHVNNNKQNIDNSPLNLAQAIAELSNDQRTKLFNLIDCLLGTKTKIGYSVPDNSMSQKFVSVDGYNISFTSSGFRLVATLLTSLLDTHYSTVLIDEPELGLSPEIQGILADLLFDNHQRNKYFPHLKSIILATHSPIFLDRIHITNNYFIERIDTEITIRQLSTVQDLNSLQFFLLGNRFETLFLPSAIILVEGKCDYKYIDRIIAIKYPRSAVSVIQCNGDSRIKEVVNIARNMLLDIQRSPYGDRIFVVLDSIHGTGLSQKLQEMGISKENIITWERNGIEHLYPKSILDKYFGSADGIKINGDTVSANGVSCKKSELAEFVIKNMSESTELPEELKKKLLCKLDAILF
ncbi:MAG: ATP-binding protein [Chloroflexi bacterium]|nr:MAG: ATP-binding protein [Chloroflexota bacterium]